MKRIGSILLVLVLFFNFSTFAIAASPDNTLETTSSNTLEVTSGNARSGYTEWLKIYRTITGKDYSGLSVNRPTTVYMSGGAAFADGIARNITVKIGTQTVNIWADGSAKSRIYSTYMNAQIYKIVEVSVPGNVPCVVALDFYSLD